MSAELSRISEAEYLALERQSEIKHEYVRGGDVYARVRDKLTPPGGFVVR